MAASRLDVDGDKIGDTLVLALVDHKKDKNTPMQDPLVSSTWEEVIICTHSCVNDLFLTAFLCIMCKQVPATNTLITPVQCKSLWSQFQRETEYTITQAIASQVSFRVNYRFGTKVEKTSYAEGPKM